MCGNILKVVLEKNMLQIGLYNFFQNFELFQY